MRWLFLPLTVMFGSDLIEHLQAKNENVVGFHSDQLDLSHNIIKSMNE